MAQRKGWSMKGGNRQGAVIHGIIGTVPIGGAQYEGYKAAKGPGSSKAAGVAGAVATSVVPGSGTVAGMYHGYHTHDTHGASPNQRNAKTAVRSSNPSQVKLKGRVGSK